MTPNIIDRLDTMIQAMTEVVMPAIGASEALAKDQAGLVIAHLTMIRAQLPLAEAFEQLELDTVTVLGRDLLTVAAGGQKTQGATELLATALDEVAADQTSTREERNLRINAAVENLVRCSRIDADADARTQIAAKVLKAGLENSWRDRVWFNGSGFDAEQHLLPPRESLFA